MANIFDTAKYILRKCGEISIWKLHKLCYYCQAWHLAWTESPMFGEDFEAWSNGPVCPELVQECKGRYMVDANFSQKGNPNTLTDDEKESIDIVLKSYGKRDPFDLREQTRSELPWKIARGNIPDGEECHNIITKESMGEYYGNL